ncbi:hypothetical protein [Paenibacillus sp. H1-7]|uniref:hypothetical protein n=1 Tax=Paenibacillus sp. H1-7 TaxID=2282849 RepID=UPI001EF93DEB|nr:hypothetical protein [Paenibacillus sp. H1-7]
MNAQQILKKAALHNGYLASYTQHPPGASPHETKRMETTGNPVSGNKKTHKLLT